METLEGQRLVRVQTPPKAGTSPHAPPCLSTHAKAMKPLQLGAPEGNQGAKGDLREGAEWGEG